MKHLPVYRIEGKGWWKQDMKSLRRRARETDAPEQLSLVQHENPYLPCKYCNSDKCKIAPLKPGMSDPAYPFPWTRANPQSSTAQIHLTSCEEAELKEVYASLGVHVPEERAVTVKEPPQPKPVFSARQTAEKILAVCHARRARTVERLCELAGIDVTDVVERVLDFLAEHGKILCVMKNKWVLND